MANLILPDRWKIAPIAAAGIDHRGIGAGLKFALTTGRIGAWPIPVLAGLAQEATPNGVGNRGSGLSTVRWADQDLFHQTNPVAGFSYLCVFYKTGNAAGYSRLFGRTANDGTLAPYLNWNFQLNAGAAGQASGAINYSASGSSIVTINADNIILGFNSLAGVFLPGMRGARAFSQGVFRDSNTTSLPSEYATGSDVYIGASGSMNYQNIGSVVLLAAVWHRALADAEVFELHQNPWQIFSSPQRRIYFGAVSAQPTGGFFNSGLASPGILTNRGKY